MKKWQNYSIEEIRSGVNEDGARLILSFCQDYKKIFGSDADCCHSCPSFENKVRKLIQKANEMEKVENSGFKLKPMYEGIQEKFGGNPISSSNLTDKLAIRLIKKHPRGKDLFMELPKDVDSMLGIKEKIKKAIAGSKSK